MLVSVDWGIVFDSLVAGGTLVLAAATFVLARRTREGNQLAQQGVSLTREELMLTRASLSASIRPVLVDVPPGGFVRDVRYAPTAEVYTLHEGEVHVSQVEGFVLCSVPFRNIGTGAAVINGLGFGGDPSWSGSLTRSILPPSEITRATFAIPKDRAELEDLITHVLQGSFTVEVRYTDVDGQQDALTTAHLYGEEGSYYVRQIALRRPGELEPFVMSGPAGD